MDSVAAHSSMADLAPLRTAACWDAASLRSREDWIHRLDDSERNELVAATDRVRGRDLTDIAREDFPLPRLAKRLAHVRADVLNGVGLALLRRLPVAECDEESAARLLWGIGIHMGVPQPQDASGALLHHVRDTGARVQGRDDVRTFETNEAQPWHNDGGDIFALMCRDTANSGGKSFVVSVHAVYNRLLERDPALLRTLLEVFHFDARGQALPGHGPVQSVPVLSWHDGHLFILYKRHYIELAQRFDEVPRLSQAQRDAIDALEEACNDPSLHLAFDLSPGDLEIANNFTVLHKRGSFDEGGQSPSRRHMLRLWLGMRDGWSLPNSFRGTREYDSLFSARAK